MVTKAPDKPQIAVDLSWLADFVPDFSGDQDELIQQLTAAFLAAYQQHNPAAEVTQALKDRAAAFARQRAGELIQDLSDATRERVRELTAAALENGDSIQTLARALRAADDLFGKQRAETISWTETAIALGTAQREAAEDMDQDEKSSVAESDACDDCAANADDGWIAIDDVYSSGDDRIPFHPRCRCGERYRTARLHEEDAAPVAIVKEVHCGTCGRWVGRNVNVGATIFCPKCKESVVGAYSIGGRTAVNSGPPSHRGG